MYLCYLICIVHSSFSGPSQPVLYFASEQNAAKLFLKSSSFPSCLNAFLEQANLQS